MICGFGGPRIMRYEDRGSKHLFVKFSNVFYYLNKIIIQNNFSFAPLV